MIAWGDGVSRPSYLVRVKQVPELDMAGVAMLRTYETMCSEDSASGSEVEGRATDQINDRD